MSEHGSDDEDYHMPYHQQMHPFGGGGNAQGLFNNPLFGGFGAMMGQMGPQMPAPPGAFNRVYKAFSSVMYEISHGKGNQGAHTTAGGRTQVMFGGQIMLPQSALRQLTELDIASPWTFELISNKERTIKTHAGVLEFHGEEGNVYLPSWMMRRLELQEGENVRLYGTQLPKGKFVKLQAQSVMFLELSDPKAVLEQALRNYTALTIGDIIEISYNMMTFELLVMEIQPVGAGINILNTDLEVDFAAPKGYVEPERKPAAPIPTMKSKLQINTKQTQDVDGSGKASNRGSGTSTPAPAGPSGSKPNGTAPGASKAEGAAAAAPAPAFEAFKGIGNTMAGKRIRGKGISVKKQEGVSEDSKIFRTDQVRIITPDMQIGTRQVPAALHLPEGVLFFDFEVKPPPSNATEGSDTLRQTAGGPKPPDFTGAGAGVTLSGRPPKPDPSAANSKASTKAGKKAKGPPSGVGVIDLD